MLLFRDLSKAQRSQKTKPSPKKEDELEEIEAQKQFSKLINELGILFRMGPIYLLRDLSKAQRSKKTKPSPKDD
jgi:hypothetical protein